MHFSTQVIAAILAFTAVRVAAAPIPQVAGEGNACGSILTDFDNGVGYGIEDAEDNIAKTINPNSNPSQGAGTKRRRQIAGEGNACKSILTDFDNGVGYGIEDAEDNIAKTINPNSNPTQGGGSTGGGAAPPPPPPPPPAKGPKSRRQLDKISHGLQAVSEAAGTGSATDAATTELVDLDGTLTGDATDAGAEIGDLEVSSLEGIGSSVPKTRRQLDKISHGLQAISEAAGTGSATDAATTELVDLDGTLTTDASNAGAEIGDLEVSTLEGIGSSVP